MSTKVQEKQTSQKQRHVKSAQEKQLQMGQSFLLRIVSLNQSGYLEQF